MYLFSLNRGVVRKIEISIWTSFPEVGIYKRKQDLDQESDQEKKKVFSVAFLVEFLFSCFLV